MRFFSKAVGPISEQAGNFGDRLDTAARPFAIDPQPGSIGDGGGAATELDRLFAGENPVGMVGLQGDQVVVFRHVNFHHFDLRCTSCRFVAVCTSVRLWW